MNELKVSKKRTKKSVAMDIEDQKDVAEASTQEERYYRTLLHSLHEDILVIDRDYRITDINNKALQTLGLSRKEVIGRLCYEVSHKRYAPCHEQGEACGLRRVFDTGESCFLRHQHITAEGENVHVDILMSPLLDEDGNITHVVEAARNITDLFQAQGALAESEDRYRALFEHNADALMVVDPESGAILEFNDKAYKNLGYTREEFEHVTLADIESMESAEEIEAHVQKIREEGADSFETKHRTKDGKTRDILVNSQLIRVGGKRVIISILHDITERKHTEEKILDLARFPSENPNAVIRLSGDGIVLYANEAANTVLKSWQTALHREVPERWRQVIEETLKTGKTTLEEDRVGSRILSFNVSPVVSADYVNLYARDITKLRRVEEEREDLARFPSENPNPVLRVAKEGKVLYANEAAARVLESWHTALYEDVPERWQRIALKALATGEGVLEEDRMGDRILSFSVSPVVDAGYVNLYARDITERKRAEEKTRDLAKFPSENPNPVLRLDRDGKVLYANYAAQEVLKNWQTALQKDVPRRWQQIVKETLETGEGKLEEERIGDRILSFNVAPVMDAGYVNLYVRDITEHRHAEEATRKAQEALLEQQCHETERVESELAKVKDELMRKARLAAIGQMSGSIAHDIRNPLGTINNACYLLRRRIGKEQSKVHDTVGIIEQEVKRANHIITNLMAVARSRSPQKQTVGLRALIQDVFQRLDHNGNVEFRIELESDFFSVHVDPDQFTQVVTNLLTNAFQAMNGSGTFTARARHQNRLSVIEFLDTGPGLDPEIRDNLFDPLVTTKTLGTGLGLTICKQIVEAHGGTIEAVDNIGGGALIRIQLLQEETQ